MNYNEMRKIACDNDLGSIIWETKTALNTGNLIEVGYVWIDKSRELFCKRSGRQEFYLCNQFRKLNGTE